MVVSLLAAVVMSSFGSHMVLCIGQDGHVGIEPIVNGQCSCVGGDAHPDHHETTDNPISMVSSDDCCHQCTDIPLSLLPLADRKVSKKNPTARQAAVSVASNVSPLPFRAAASRKQSSIFDHRALSLPDATVVLRI